MAVRKFRPVGDILADVLPLNVSKRENLPPISMSPTWDLLFDSSGAAEIPKAGLVKIVCASRSDSRVCAAKGPVVPAAILLTPKLWYSERNAATRASIASWASVPTIGTNGDVV